MAFWLGSQVLLDIQVPSDCNLFVWKSVNCTYRKKNSHKLSKTTRKDEKVDSNSSLYNDTEKVKIFWTKKKK